MSASPETIIHRWRILLKSLKPFSHRFGNVQAPTNLKKTHSKTLPAGCKSFKINSSFIPLYENNLSKSFVPRRLSLMRDQKLSVSQIFIFSRNNVQHPKAVHNRAEYASEPVFRSKQRIKSN
jgi:hypothetical protein